MDGFLAVNCQATISQSLWDKEAGAVADPWRHPPPYARSRYTATPKRRTVPFPVNNHPISGMKMTEGKRRI
jgi:hypothetical protein